MTPGRAANNFGHPANFNRPCSWGEPANVSGGAPNYARRWQRTEGQSSTTTFYDMILRKSIAFKDNCKSIQAFLVLTSLSWSITHPISFVDSTTHTLNEGILPFTAFLFSRPPSCFPTIENDKQPSSFSLSFVPSRTPTIFDSLLLNDANLPGSSGPG